MKRILALALVGLLVGVQAFASTNSAQVNQRGSFYVAHIDVPSQAQSAIDTTVVALANADWDMLANSTLASSQIWLPMTLQFLGATGVDSTNTGIDYSLDGTTWSEVYSLNNTASNLTTTVPAKILRLSVPTTFIRIRAKNVDSTTGISDLDLVWPKR